jgi:signal transduction histidine kinase
MSPFVYGLLAGLLVGAIVLVRRVRSERDRADKAEKLAEQSRHLAEVGTLTGALAHEIKNPLSTIGLNLQLLQEDLDHSNLDHSNQENERLRNRLSTVQRETNRLRDTLDDFLRYAGKLELDRHPVDLNQVLEELADFFAPQAHAQRVQLRLRPSATPVVAMIDARVVKQALLNLMINAVQAMTGGGELMLSVAGENGEAVVDVIDTGPGIPRAELDKIFQAYYSTKKGGTGLGLAMARRIATDHGGTLNVRSDVGKGTDFSLRLPLAKETAAPAKTNG